MRSRIVALSVNHRSLLKATTPLLLSAVLALLFYYSFRLSDSVRASAAAPIHLVRLSINDEAGMVRIEVIADSSLGEATVEQFTRGSETVVRIRGARSLLNSSYEIGDRMARHVRTLAGERDGEPFVDIVIALGEGATVAQRKIFNRLVIGVASDFARLRWRAPADENAEVARARSSMASRPVAVDSIPVTSAVPDDSRPASEQASFKERPEVEGYSQLASVSAVNAPQASGLVAATPEGQTVFRGRNIWGSIPQARFKFSRQNPSRFAQSFQPQQNALNSALPPATTFAPFTLDAPGATRGVWIPGTTTSSVDEIGGKSFGPGVLRPSFQFTSLFGDNFFYRSADGRNLGLFGIIPRLEYEIPGERRALRVAYDMQLRRLTNGEWANGHRLDFDTRMELSPFFIVSVRNHFVRSSLDPREYDPAGEVYIIGDTFWRNDGALRLEYNFDERNRFSTSGGYNIVRWSEDHIAASPLFINYDELQLDASYERDFTAETTGLATFTYGQTDASVPLRPQFENDNNRRRYAFELGVRRRMSQTSGLAAKAGFERSLFYNAPRENNFSGLIFNLLYRTELSSGTNFELATLRKTQVSAFNLEGGNVRLVSTGGAARLEQAVAGLKMGLGVNYQQLGFPVAVVPTTTASGGVFAGNFAGERRKDHLYGLFFETSYKWSEYLRSRFVYNFSRRVSTIPVFTFNRHRLSLVFDLGLRNDVRGRPF
jgi:hypothetical protein